MGPSSPRQEKTGVPSLVQSGSENKLLLILPFCSPFYFLYVAFLRPCQFRDVIKLFDLHQPFCSIRASEVLDKVPHTGDDALSHSVH